ncbi:MAG: hypothetical protein NXY57DRAFT_395421, partial [Lentinula lateritia]
MPSSFWVSSLLLSCVVNSCMSIQSNCKLPLALLQIQCIVLHKLCPLILDAFLTFFFAMIDEEMLRAFRPELQRKKALRIGPMLIGTSPRKNRGTISKMNDSSTYSWHSSSSFTIWRENGEYGFLAVNRMLERKVRLIIAIVFFK